MALNQPAFLSRLTREFFECRVMDNALRGYWCEAMVAEALGPECRITSANWAPRDLEIGPESGVFPQRIRLQVKNSACRQTWHGTASQPSDTLFSLTWRNRPAYWTRDFLHRPCKASGFLCDAFVLCHHPGFDEPGLDQGDTSQWQVYLVSARPETRAITPKEFARLRAGREGQSRRSIQRSPKSLREGRMGSAGIEPIPMTKLTMQSVRDTLAILA
jgi:hypothetical protein